LRALGVALQQLQRQADQVVEVHRLVGLQALLVQAHHARGHALVVVAGGGFGAGGVQALVLPQADGPLPAPRQRVVGAAAGVAQHAQHVVAVEDAEVLLQAHALAVLRSMRTPRLWKVLTARSLAARGPTSALARSRISCAALLVKVMAAICFGLEPGLQQPRDLVHDDARLARPGTGQHQAGAHTGGAPPGLSVHGGSGIIAATFFASARQTTDRPAARPHDQRTTALGEGTPCSSTSATRSNSRSVPLRR
jgi:hypothetical protein